MYKWLSIVIAIRAISAFCSPIMDCDETFNYLEPLHYLLYHSGLQPWEYSPEYSLRSWCYIKLHALVLSPLSRLGLVDRFTMFYVLRGCIGVVCGLGEVAFVDAVEKKFCSPKLAKWTLVFLVTNSGMFHSSVAFIPTSFAMHCTLFAYAAWFNGYSLLALCIGAYAFTTWPYVVVMFVTISVEYLVEKGVIKTVAHAALVCLVFVALPSLVDSLYYAKPVIPSLNQIIYNVMNDGTQRYGVEPWFFYLLNLTLNFNVVAALALVCPMVLALRPHKRLDKKRHARLDYFLVLLPTYAWLLICSTQPHKEERFLAMTYPGMWQCVLPPTNISKFKTHSKLIKLIVASTVLCLSAALSLDAMVSLTKSVLGRGKAVRVLLRVGLAMLILLSVIVNLSRSCALVVNFGAPNRLFMHMYNAHIVPETLCYEKEWYRFPSSFMLPQSDDEDADTRTELMWIKSEFDGLLPQPFAPWPNGTSIVPPFMNDKNEEQMEAYSELSACHYAVHFDDHPGKLEGLGPMADWSKIKCFPFLNLERSKPIVRSFYIPFGMSQKVNVYSDYCLLKRVPKPSA